MNQVTRFTIAMVISVFIVGLCACEPYVLLALDGDDTVDSKPPYAIDDLPIQNVTVAILESFPPQVNLLIEGYLTDGCTTLHETAERRDGNTIHVQITTKRPKDFFCAAVVTEIQPVVALGFFDPGMYKVIVNGVEVEFEI